MHIGAMIRREIPPGRVIDAARELEPAFDEIWVVEDLPYAGGIAQASAVLAATEGVRVGHGIAPAPFRTPAALAMEWATLAGMWPGRFIAGIGHGVQSWMSQIGEGVRSPLALLEETTTAVRRLLAGETVTVEGRYVSLDALRLQFPPDQAPPVLAGVRGPRSLELAGAVADGTILAEGTGPDHIRAARRLIERGRQSAGRGDPHHLTVFAAFAVATTDVAAVNDPGWAAFADTTAGVTAHLQRLVAAGPDSLVLVPFALHDPMGQLAIAASEIVPALDHP